MSHDDAAGIAHSHFTGANPALIPPFDYGTLMHEGARWGDGMPDIVQETGAIRADTEDGRDLIEDAWQSQLSDYNRKLAVLETAFERLADDSSDFDRMDLLDNPMVEDVEVEPWDPLGIAEDEDDLAETYTTGVRYAMYCLGRHRGPSVYLYDKHGTGIGEPSEYEQLIEDIEENDTRDEELDWYVVPVDVHY